MHFKITFIAFLATLISTTANAVPVKESQLNSNNQKPQSLNITKSFSTRFRPPNKNQPQHTVGGATRGNLCSSDKDNKSEITALVPEQEQTLTLNSHPNFFAYISPTNEDRTAILIVKDDTEDYYFSKKLTLSATGGVIKMSLPEDAPPLEIGKSYTWFLRIQCNTYLEPEDPQISASITRVKGNIPSLSQDELILFYSDNQIWYDSLNTAFNLVQSGKDIYWSELLNNIGMSKVIDVVQ